MGKIMYFILDRDSRGVKIQRYAYCIMNLVKITNRCGKSPPSLKSDIIKYILGGATKLYSRKNLVPLYERSLILNILVIVYWPMWS